MTTSNANPHNADRPTAYPRLTVQSNALTVEFAPPPSAHNMWPLVMILDFSAADSVLGIEILDLMSQTGRHALGAIDQVARPRGHGPLYTYDAKVDAFYFYLCGSSRGQSGISKRQREVPGIAVLDGAGRIVTLHATW